MSWTIGELRAEDLVLLRELSGWQAGDAAAMPDPATPLALSLVVRQDEAVLAAMFCTHEEGRYTHRLVHDPDRCPPEAVQTLLNKALVKLASHRIRRCRFVLDDQFLAGFRWRGDVAA